MHWPKRWRPQCAAVEILARLGSRAAKNGAGRAGRDNFADHGCRQWCRVVLSRTVGAAQTSRSGKPSHPPAKPSARSARHSLCRSATSVRPSGGDIFIPKMKTRRSRTDRIRGHIACCGLQRPRLQRGAEPAVGITPSNWPRPARRTWRNGGGSGALVFRPRQACCPSRTGRHRARACTTAPPVGRHLVF